jgi:hypothetical protein
MHVMVKPTATVVFSWQGGEPTLLGLDFFRRVAELEKKYCQPHVRREVTHWHVQRRPHGRGEEERLDRDQYEEGLE